MRNSAFLFVNGTLITTCIIMLLVFLFLPLPKKKGLKNYRISLRYLALAYFTLSVITSMDMLQGSSTLDYPLVLTALSFQMTLFVFALITLFNINFANKVYVAKLLSPTILFIVLSLVSRGVLGSPSLNNFSDFVRNYTHPTAMLDILFLLYCIAQLIYFIQQFLIQEKRYDSKLDDYYADTYQLQLTWVRYCFIGACSFGILVIVSMFFSSTTLNLIVTGFNSLFYLVFGLCYIQYPRTYVDIEPILIEHTANVEESEVQIRKLSWDKLRAIIIADKYYLRPDVNIEEMAQYLKIGRTKLSNYINQEEGMNFHAWINTLRIEEAKQHILANPSCTFAQVAELVGYSEQSNFSRQFKQVTNQAPSVWKQAQQENRLN